MQLRVCEVIPFPPGVEIFHLFFILWLSRIWLPLQHDISVSLPPTPCMWMYREHFDLGSMYVGSPQDVGCPIVLPDIDSAVN